MQTEEFIHTIKKHQNLIYKICYSYCDTPNLRQDLEQEILIQLWESFKTYNGSVKLSTWIYRVALNTAISFYRKNKKHSYSTLQINESIIDFPEEDKTIKNENINQLYFFINKLSDLDKALILLYLDDYKHEEIASVLGISKTNVATKISRIKLKLKTEFNK